MAQIRPNTLPRGIQEGDVWAAADLLLHEGLRPTIESVRNATRLLWETARREAEEVERVELELVRSELQERGNALVEA